MYCTGADYSYPYICTREIGERENYWFEAAEDLMKGIMPTSITVFSGIRTAINVYKNQAILVGNQYFIGNLTPCHKRYKLQVNSKVDLPQVEGVDWRPNESIPEDYYAA